MCVIDALKSLKQGKKKEKITEEKKEQLISD
jgi:hypothetical protein